MLATITDADGPFAINATQVVGLPHRLKTKRGSTDDPVQFTATSTWERARRLFRVWRTRETVTVVVDRRRFRAYIQAIQTVRYSYRSDTSRYTLFPLTD